MKPELPGQSSRISLTKNECKKKKRKPKKKRSQNCTEDLKNFNFYCFLIKILIKIIQLLNRNFIY